MKVRANIKRAPAAAKELERVVKKELRDAAMKAEEEAKREKMAKKAKKKGGKGGA